MSACDYSWARYTAAQLQAAGVTAVGRYLNGSGKSINSLELAGLLFGGIEVWLVFEISATDASGPASQGVNYAQQANNCLLNLGLPLSTPVYFAADTDYVNPAQAVPYFQGIASVRSPMNNGCYGEGALIDLLANDGLSHYGWESESTSFPGNAVQSSNANIWQKVNGAPLPQTDLDVILKQDFGQLPRPTPIPGGDVPASTDVVDTWVVPGTGGSQRFDLHADGGLFAQNGAAPSVLEYVAVANDGNSYHFGPSQTPGVISYPGLPPADRQGSRYFNTFNVLSYNGVVYPQKGDAGPAGPAGPAGAAGSSADVNPALKAALQAATNSVP